MKTEQLMSYLYGEMDEAEAAAFRAELASSPELQQELAALQEMRELLADWKDEVPQPLPSLPAKREKRISFSPYSFAAGIAASLLLLAFVAIAAGVSLRYSEPGGFSLAIGNPGNSFVSKAEFSGALDTLRQLRSVPLQQQPSFTGPATAQKDRLTEHEVQLLMKASREQNEKNMKALIGMMQQQQEKQLDHTMLVFARYLDMQRQSDIRTISSELERIRTSSEDKFYETDQALNKLFQSVQYARK